MDTSLDREELIILLGRYVGVSAFSADGDLRRLGVVQRNVGLRAVDPSLVKSVRFLARPRTVPEFETWCLSMSLDADAVLTQLERAEIIMRGSAKQILDNPDLVLNPVGEGIGLERSESIYELVGRDGEVVAVSELIYWCWVFTTALQPFQDVVRFVSQEVLTGDPDPEPNISDCALALLLNQLAVADLKGA